MKDKYFKKLLKVGTYSLAVAIPSPYCKYLGFNNATPLISEITNDSLVIKKADKITNTSKQPFTTGKFTLAYTVTQDFHTVLGWNSNTMVEITMCENAIIVRKAV